MAHTYYGLKNSSWTEGFIAYQIKTNENEERTCWELMAIKLGMGFKRLKKGFVLNGHLYHA